MLITGQLSEYSLPLLIEILTGKGETGVLVLEHAEYSGVLHFVNGKLTSARVGGLIGQEALDYADALGGATFRFERLSLAQISRKLWSETMEAPPEEDRAGERDRGEPTPSALLRLNRFHPADTDIPASGSFVPDAEASAGLSAAPRETHLSRFLLVVLPACVFLIVFAGLYRHRPAVATNRESAPIPSPEAAFSRPAAPSPTPIDILSPLNNMAPPAPTATVITEGVDSFPSPKAENRTAHTSPAPPTSVIEQGAVPRKSPQPSPAVNPGPTPGARTEQPSPSASPQTITVMLQIENGRVSQAFVLGARPGREAYEASALRTARQRRYPASFSGQEKVSILVEQP